MKATSFILVLVPCLLPACGAVEPAKSDPSASSDAGSGTTGSSDGQASGPTVDQTSDGGEREPGPDAAAPPAPGTAAWSVGSKSWTGRVACAIDSGVFFMVAEGAELGRTITVTFKNPPSKKMSYAVNASGAPATDSDVAVVVAELSPDEPVRRTAISGSVWSTPSSSFITVECKNLPAALDGNPSDVQLVSGTLSCPL